MGHSHYKITTQCLEPFPPLAACISPYWVFPMLGEAPIGPPPKSPVGRLIGAASVHLPRAGAVSFDERYYPVPNPRQLSRFSRRRIPSAISRSVLRPSGKNSEHQRQGSLFRLLDEDWGPDSKAPQAGGSWPADDRINWLKMPVMGCQVAYALTMTSKSKRKRPPTEAALLLV